MSKQDRKKRKILQEEWDAWVERWKQFHDEERELRDGEASDEEEEYEAKEVEVEEILDVKEVVVPFNLDQME